MCCLFDHREPVQSGFVCCLMNVQYDYNNGLLPVRRARGQYRAGIRRSVGKNQLPRLSICAWTLHPLVLTFVWCCPETWLAQPTSSGSISGQLFSRAHCKQTCTRRLATEENAANMQPSLIYPTASLMYIASYSLNWCCSCYDNFPVPSTTPIRIKLAHVQCKSILIDLPIMV